MNIFGTLLLGLFAVVGCLVVMWMVARADGRMQTQARDPQPNSDAEIMPAALIRLLNISATFEVPLDPRNAPDELLKAGAYAKTDPDFDPWTTTGRDRAPRVEIVVDDDPFSWGVESPQQAQTVQMHLVTFDIAARTDDILEALDAHYLKPATATDLLAFGADQNAIAALREHPIAALGSPQRTDGTPARFPAIHALAGRTIGFGWQDEVGRWDGYWRFLVVNAPRPDQTVTDAT